MTPLQNLLSSHFSKDINNNFIEALEALLFLTPPTQKELEVVATFTQKLEDKVDLSRFDGSDYEHYKDSIGWNKSYRVDKSDDYLMDREDLVKKIHALQRQEEKSQIKHSYNLAEFITYKLVEALRRNYAAEKSSNTEESNGSGSVFKIASLNLNSPVQKKSSNNVAYNKESLTEQLRCICKMIDMMQDYLHFTNKNNYFPRAILGKDVSCKAIELWAYLYFHEFLPENYKELHEKIFNKHFEGKVVGREFLNHFQKLLYRPEDKKVVHKLLAVTDPSIILDQFTNPHNRSKDCYGWLLLSFEHLLNSNIKVSKEQKESLFKRFTSSDLMDNKFYSQFVDTKTFEIKLEQFFTQETKQLLPSWFSKYINPSALGNLKFVDVIFNQIDELSSTDLFYRTLVSKEVNEYQKASIVQKYVKTTPKLIELATYINKNAGSQKKKFMLDFFNIINSFDNKELLAHVISLDPAYMEVCKSIYQNLRLQEKVPKNSNEVKRLKI